MRVLDAPFVGLLYCGLILTQRGIRVIEFNARFGDPETQVVLRRLQTPLEILLHSAARGHLDTAPIPTFSDEKAVAVVLASEGYPESSAPSRVIRGLRKAVLGQSSKVEICHAATVQKNNSAGKLEFLSTGGRVLTIVAVGKTFAKARKRAYRAISRIKFEGSHFRSDIAAKVSE